MKNYYFYSTHFLSIISNHKELIGFISLISKKKDNLIIYPQKIINILENPSSKAQAIDSFKKRIGITNNEVLEIVRSKRPNNIYDLTNSFISDLNLFDFFYNDNSRLIKELKSFPDIHTDAYSEKQVEQTFKLAETSSTIIQSINDVREKSLFIINELNKTKKEIPKEYSVLRIGTDQDIPLIDDFISIFKNVQDLYNLICVVHKIDGKEHQLILNNISTGSWFTEVLGMEQVIISIERLLIGIGTFIRDLIIGKISRERFENECKKNEAFIDLIAKAKENGIDNFELGLYKHLNPLVDNFSKDTTVIEINEVEILKLKKNEKLTLIERKNERKKILEKINLSLEVKKTKKDK